jgi:hypothetical protein
MYVLNAATGLLRYFDLGEAGPLRAGFLTQSPAGSGCTAVFDHVAFGHGTPADLPAGRGPGRLRPVRAGAGSRSGSGIRPGTEG